MFSCIIFLTSSIIMSQQIKEIIILIKQNKQLIHTIKSILQVFPEGVTIRSLDPTSMSVVSMFANDVFKQISSSLAEADDTQVKLTAKQGNNSEPHEHTMSLDTFMSHQEQQMANTDQPNMLEHMIEINCKDVSDMVQHSKDEPDRSSFNVKTTKVIWNNKHSYMHVFIDTTNVRRLETAKVKHSLQHKLFASASHEFRTPLNAFSNALNLMRMSYSNVKQTLEGYPHVNSKLTSTHAVIDKMLKIADVSSMQLS